MKTIYGLDFERNKSSVTIGKFDGIHKGHRALIDNIRKKEQWESTVLTFQMPKFRSVIYTQEEKNEILERMGVKRQIVLPFDDTIKNMSAKTFISEILVQRLQAKYICVGNDFCFGKNRLGNVDTLWKYQDKYGYVLQTVDKLKDDNEVISSTRVRSLLLRGEIEKANALLCDAYFIAGNVVHGNALGRTITFPTANLVLPSKKEILPFGVYATTVECCGKIYYGITNVGQKPTIGKNSTGVETHILDFEKDIYGEKIKVNFHHYLRKECKFTGLEQLQKQIRQDRQAALAYLQESVNIDSHHAIPYN